LLFQASQARGDGAGQQVDQQRLDTAVGSPYLEAVPASLAVKNADDGIVPIQQRGGDDGVQQYEASRIGLVSSAWLLPAGGARLEQAFEDMPAGPPVRAVGGPVRSDDLPGILLAEQEAAAVQADRLHEGLAGTIEEVGSADGALQHAERTRHALQEQTHLER